MRVPCNSKNADGQNGFNDVGLDNSSQDSFSAGFPISAKKDLSSVAVTVTPDQSKDQDAVHGTPLRAFERRRTTSSSRREDSFEEDQVDVIPFDVRLFPLPDDEVKQMLAAAKELEEENGPIIPDGVEDKASLNNVKEEEGTESDKLKLLQVPDKSKSELDEEPTVNNKSTTNNNCQSLDKTDQDPTHQAVGSNGCPMIFA
jgi:hypothetical protein